MATRKIMDCVDTTTGEKIYPVGHAMATYASDGKTLQEKFDDGDFLDKTKADELYQPKGDYALKSELTDNVAYPLVDHDTDDTTFELTPNTLHVWGEVTALTLTLGAEEDGRVNEYAFQFTSGATATTLTLPSDLVWANGEALTPEASKTYQVSIVNGLAVYTTFE